MKIEELKKEISKKKVARQACRKGFDLQTYLSHLITKKENFLRTTIYDTFK